MLPPSEDSVLEIYNVMVLKSGKVVKAEGLRAAERIDSIISKYVEVHAC